MIDINFYRNFHERFGKDDLDKQYSVEELMDILEGIRSKKPVVYNIETTNRCNMRCKMCPRTTMMTRKNEDIKRDTFINIVNQLRPHTEEEWTKWVRFCENTYGIYENEMSENHFFLYIIPKVIQLHGYGDPLLDKNMADYVEILHERGFYSYFSCNPSNIDLDRTFEMLDKGLDYINLNP